MEHARLHPAEGHHVSQTPTASSKSSVDKPAALAQLERLAVLPSPVKRIPPEILAHIFDLCVIRGNDPLPISTQAPLSLARVCGTWREIAHSNPRLWTYLNISFSEACVSRAIDLSKASQTFDLWLRMSSTLPISFTFIDRRIYHSATEGLIRLLVDRLRQNSRRWKSISIQLSGAYFLTLYTFTLCDLASLEHLSIHGDVLRVWMQWTALNLTDAPNLKSLAYSAPGDRINDTINVPWDRLTEVSFEFTPSWPINFQVSRHLPQLAQCQNITTCSLGIGERVHSGAGDPQSITLLCLRTLRVRRLSPRSHIRSAIDPLILPRLQTLEIDAAFLLGRKTRWHDRQFSNLLARSSCSLENLTIRDVYFPDEELFRCLAHSRELRLLCFMPCPRTYDILGITKKLDVSRSAGADAVVGRVGARLRELKLACTSESCFEGITKMLLSRVGASARVAGVDALQRFELVFFDLSTETDLSVRSARWARLDMFRDSLGQIAAVNENLEVKFTVDVPYLPQYIDVIPGR
ncbi:hypothetical protein BU15DRAFT_49369 [Melanogaster broomeanus]|nr:hypothetical protein BU15DRAFT_49369 [Melanogaster broomeanus]